MIISMRTPADILRGFNCRVGMIPAGDREKNQHEKGNHMAAEHYDAKCLLHWMNRLARFIAFKERID